MGKVGYSRHFFAFSTTATLFQVQTSSKFVTQESIHNIMPKHENNALQKKFYNQLKKGTFAVEGAHAWDTLDMSMGYT